jgi:carbonic anhydrase/acetyltransferase-like protein (isoleucine patch superfamily)
MPVVNYLDQVPQCADDVFIAPNAFVIGRVQISEGSSVFYAATVRGDLEPIVIGVRSNIQDAATIHTSDGRGPCIVEDEVTVGHGAILHGCTIRSRVLVGMGAVILDDAEIGSFSLVAARSLVTAKMKIPEGVLVMGSPAKVVRDLTEIERNDIVATAERYVRVSREHLGMFSI